MHPPRRGGPPHSPKARPHQAATSTNDKQRTTLLAGGPGREVGHHFRNIQGCRARPVVPHPGDVEVVVRAREPAAGRHLSTRIRGEHRFHISGVSLVITSDYEAHYALVQPINTDPGEMSADWNEIRECFSVEDSL